MTRKRDIYIHVCICMYVCIYSIDGEEVLPYTFGDEIGRVINANPSCSEVL